MGHLEPVQQKAFRRYLCVMSLYKVTFMGFGTEDGNVRMIGLARGSEEAG